MSNDIITTRGFIDVQALSEEVDPLLTAFNVTRTEGVTRLEVSEAAMPTFGVAAEVLKDAIWVDVEQTPGHVSINFAGVLLAEGQPDDEMTVIDVAKVIEHNPNTDMLEAVESMSWIDGDTGGAATYHGTHFTNYTDTAEVLDEARSMNEALAAGGFEAAAGIIADRCSAMLDGIRNEDQRSAVALELYDVITGVCTDKMNESDAEAAANRF